MRHQSQQSPFEPGFIRHSTTINSKRNLFKLLCGAPYVRLMRAVIIVLLLLLEPALTGLAQNDNPRTEYDPWELLPGRAELNAAASAAGITFDPVSPVSLNRAGYALYGRRDYLHAALFFRAASAEDPRFLYPHFNLACVLSLSGSFLQGDGAEELLYHLHRYLEMDASGLDNVRRDPDLAAARARLGRLGSLVTANEQPVVWSWRGNGLVRVAGTRVFPVAEVYAWGPFGGDRAPVARESPDGRWMAFVTASPDGAGYRVQVASAAGRIRTVGYVFEDPLAVTYADINLRFSPDVTAMVAATEGGLWMLDLLDDRVRRLTEPPEGYTDLPLEWVGHELRFRRGTIVELSFAGSEWAVDTRTGDAWEVPEGRVWAGEWLGGPE